jgi:hypothetical protein
VEKALVTFSLSSSQIFGPVGPIILAASLASNAVEQDLVVLTDVGPGMLERRRLPWRPGQLTAARADYLGVEVSDLLYQTLMRRVGFQTEFEELRGSAASAP